MPVKQNFAIYGTVNNFYNNVGYKLSLKFSGNQIVFQLGMRISKQLV